MERSWELSIVPGIRVRTCRCKFLKKSNSRLGTGTSKTEASYDPPEQPEVTIPTWAVAFTN